MHYIKSLIEMANPEKESFSHKCNIIFTSNTAISHTFQYKETFEGFLPNFFEISIVEGRLKYALFLSQ